jgi:Flp pilus assembly protein TadB
VDWAILVGVFAVIFLFGTPLLAVLLETIVTLVNATLRLPVVRRLFRAARRAKESDQP